MTNNNWICNGCSEEVEKQFDTCWNCGCSIGGDNIQSQESKDLSLTDSIKQFDSLKTYKALLTIYVIIVILSMFPVIYYFTIFSKSFSSTLIFSAMWLLSIFILQSQILIIDFLFYLGSKISPEKDKGSES